MNESMLKAAPIFFFIPSLPVTRVAVIIGETKPRRINAAGINVAWPSQNVASSLDKLDRSGCIAYRDSFETCHKGRRKFYLRDETGRQR